VKSPRIPRLHDELRAAYGPQGWWPIPGRAGQAGFDAHGYHPGIYDEPRDGADRFEVIMGAILTQNTAWKNVEIALANLRAAGLRTPSTVLATDAATLSAAIRSAGYHNHKARKLHIAAERFARPDGLRDVPTRDELLSLWGIGPETADAILLYVFGVPIFVVDAYTKRLLSRMGLIEESAGYEEVQSLFHDSLPRETTLFNELHALIVEHGKRHCRARRACDGCPVTRCAGRETPR
jgi:endonuclease III related protein